MLADNRIDVVLHTFSCDFHWTNAGFVYILQLEVVGSDEGCSSPLSMVLGHRADLVKVINGKA